MSIKIKTDDFGNMICPKCKDGRLYLNDNLDLEVEGWACSDCSAEFHVDVEIKRDFDNVREAIQ